MRKILCFLISFVFLLCSLAKADEHLAVDFTVHGLHENHIATLDLFEQNNQSLFVSSLFSDLAVSVDSAGCYTRFFDQVVQSLMTPEHGRMLIKSTDQLLTEWIEQQSAATVSGSFSGNLFEQAATASTCEFLLSSFTEYLLNSVSLPDTKESRALSCQLLYYLLTSSITDHFNGSDPMIRMQIYDNGKYFSAFVSDQEDIYAILSADCSSDDQRQFVFSYKENGRYCFVHCSILFNSQSTDISSSVQTSDLSYYQNNAEPLIRETLTVSPLSGTTSSFMWSLEPKGPEENLSVSGTVSALSGGGHTEITGSISFIGSDKKIMDVHLFTESMNRAVSFSDKAMKHINKQAELSELQIAACSGIMMISSWCYSLLPSGYQDLLMKLLFR